MAPNTNSASNSLDYVEGPFPGIYDLDPSRSYLGFSVRHHIVSRVRGKFRSFRGTLTVADDLSASGIVIEIDAASIDTDDARRDARLRSADFLDVERYPTMQFRSKRVRPIAWAADGRDRWHVEGTFALRGVTRPSDLEICFEAAVVDADGTTRAGFTVCSEIMRDDLGFILNPELEAGEVIVGRRITVELELEAVRRT